MMFLSCMILLAIPIGVVLGVVSIIQDKLEEQKFRKWFGIR